MDEQWQEDKQAATLTLQQFCTGFSKAVPVETLSLFYELELEQGHFTGTVEEFQQRLEELKNRPL